MEDEQMPSSAELSQQSTEGDPFRRRQGFKNKNPELRKEPGKSTESESVRITF
jgi:hypothetical protein